jgi:hypothetical protein
MKKFLLKKGHIIIVLVLFLSFLMISLTASYSNKSVSNGEKFYELVIKNNTIFSIDEEGSLDGLYYDDLTNLYYYKGNVKNNYFVINSELWRIVSINSDKSIKVIKESGINSNKLYRYNEDYNNYKYLDSNVYNQLDMWYKEKLNNVNSYILDREFCVYFQNEKCIENKKLKIGLLTFDEVKRAGGEINTNNSNYYLYNVDSWWILDNDYDELLGSAFSGYVNLLGSIDKGFVVEEKVIRPVINISGYVNVLGDGTKDNPYFIVK